MAAFKIDLEWKRNTTDFSYKTYDRTHTVTLGSGTQLQMSAAPEYLGNPSIANPEEIFIAAISSCHMLSFLAVAALQNFVIDSYHDSASGVIGKNSLGKSAVTQVTLSPTITFSGANTPDPGALSKLHQKAHDICFIANSVSTEVIIEGLSHS
jgi:organic hydroperoxide reductase OsmC/OhrA